VVLSPAADLSQTFHVLAAFVVGTPRPGVDLTLPGAAFNGRIALDVTMTITPADPATGANTASAIGIDESAVTSVDFAGQEGVLRVARNAVSGKERCGGNVGVVGEAAVRAVSDQTIAQALHPKIRTTRASTRRRSDASSSWRCATGSVRTTGRSSASATCTSPRFPDGGQRCCTGTRRPLGDGPRRHGRLRHDATQQRCGVVVPGRVPDHHDPTHGRMHTAPMHLELIVD
jgi:hypothetical protein